MVNEVDVTIRGHVGSNPTLHKGGRVPFTRVSVATTPRVRGAEGWADGPTQWYDVKLWGEFAENVMDSVRKGDAVIVTGPLRIEEFTSEKGITWRTPVILASAFGLDLRRATATARKTDRQRPPDEPADEAGPESEAGFEATEPDGEGPVDRGEPLPADPWADVAPLAEPVPF